MTAAAKPRWQRAENITAEEADCHHWLGRLSMCLAVCSHEMPKPLKTHVRKTLDEFLGSGAASGPLAEAVRDELKGR